MAASSELCMQIVTRAQWIRAPWKNGKGVTFEIGRGHLGRHVEPDLAYHWRLSVAEITEEADFSAFDGYQRFLGVIEGAGISMAMPGTVAPRELSRFESITFDGALAPRACPLAGPTRDINLMVWRSAADFTAEIIASLTGPVSADRKAAVSLFVCLRDTLRIQREGHSEQTLKQHDGLILEVADHGLNLQLAGTPEAAIFVAHIYPRALG